MDKPIKLSMRKKARSLLLQALYQWTLSGSPLSQIYEEYAVHHNMEKVDAEYFNTLLYDIPKNVNSIDESFAPFLDRTIKDLNPIELCVLRIATYELMHRLEIPYPIILKEAVGLARTFGATDGYKFVNGVLDKTAKQLRPHEKY